MSGEGVGATFRRKGGGLFNCPRATNVSTRWLHADSSTDVTEGAHGIIDVTRSLACRLCANCRSSTVRRAPTANGLWTIGGIDFSNSCGRNGTVCPFPVRLPAWRVVAPLLFRRGTGA